MGGARKRGKEQQKHRESNKLSNSEPESKPAWWAVMWE